MISFDRKNLKGDIYGGLTAGVVALPLALAFGEASGAGPIAGLWGAIILGFFAPLFGGTGAQISGPTGPMVVIFAGAFSSLSGNLSLVFTAVVLAGLLQMSFGFFKLGQYIRLVPYPVVSGFMSGIGVIIIALQVARLFGHEPEAGGPIPALSSIPNAVMNPNLSAVSIGLITLAVVFFWPKKFNRYVPNALAGLIIGTLIAFFIEGSPTLGEIPTGLPSFIMPALTRDTFSIVLETAFILALLGSLDSLLTSLVADNMTSTRHNSDRELIGQGVGNSLAGLFGAIPGAGATMCTVVNIRSGGETKISGMLHATVILIIVMLLVPLASKIPHAVLAAILFKVGYDIIDFSYLKRAHKGPRWDLALMVSVLGLTVFVDLITAVAVGVIMAALAFVKKLADDQLAAIGETQPRVTTDEEKDILKRANGRITMFDFGGPLSFGAAADLGHQVKERVRVGTRAVVLDFTRVPFIDVSAAMAVETISCDTQKAGKALYITGMKPKVRQVLSVLNADCCFLEDNQYEERIDALKHILGIIEKERMEQAS